MTAAAPPLRAEAAVIGAGPAGATAAAVLARAGVSTVLIDEAAAPGGRVWRAPPDVLRARAGGPELAEGDALRARVAGAGAQLLAGAVVWSVTELGGRFRIDVMTDGGMTDHGPRVIEARLLLVATGALERVSPFPGWTTPGVIGLAAATILLKSQRMAPGRRLVVAGAGPLLAAVAAGALKAGAEVVAVADLNGAADWARAAPALAGRPALAARGAGWVAAMLRAGVRPGFRTGVRAAHGDMRLEAVELGPVDAEGAPVAGAPTRRVACDALAVGHGLAPATEITRLLRAAHVFDRARGGWLPETDDACRTSAPRLYAAGDGAGVLGAAAALAAGERAAAAMLADLGRGPAPRPAPGASRAARFGAAMGRLSRQRPAATAAIAPGTVVCRCEDVTRAEIDAAFDAGATDLNQLKHFTRCGMGPCQGRVCGDAAAELLALRLAGRGGVDAARRAVGQWTGRAPLRPVPLDALIGAFDYADIPVPDPAPL
ncbi:NAD(P)/FAD-dependent oxidoreductase [Rubrimonas cliftonensis]|uniref:Thioredoxin reductase n=1 Tax=Rubrimonas cliftonensis TaxID=89524 RepID=A0A1H3YMW8_9RHOB|nr:NAD(P)/FAD-dependent oxidoreductase [Rubrimonas cliftonensis]SEA12875.1 Thioredoxin reductase [Rubrimonas cliftonensis]